MKMPEDVLSYVKTLTRPVPICAWCRTVRNAQGDWERLEAYFQTHTDIDFTHGICPDCLAKFGAPESKPWARNASITRGPTGALPICHFSST